MIALKRLSCLAALVAALSVGGPQEAAAQPAPTSCATKMDNYWLSDDVGWLDVVGTRVSSRGTFGFSSFTMTNGYSLATYPLNTSGAAARSTFMASKGSGHFSGLFHEVFPGRGNNDVDRWELWFARSGALWIRSVTWGGGWIALTGTTCYSGAGGQTMTTAHSYNASTGVHDVWVFVMRPNQLI